MLQTRLLPLVVFLTCPAPVTDLAAQGLPENEFSGGQTISSTVEILLAGANGVLAGYNGLILYQNRRQQFAAGVAVITGTIGVVLGTHEDANHPAIDLVFGTAALLIGGANLLIMRAPAGPPLRALRIGSGIIFPPADNARPALVARLALGAR